MKDKETTQAKIRNKLGPYKNLVALILDAPDNPKVKEFIKTEAEKIRDGFDDLLELVDNTVNEME
ncbi:MAG TPA: hypothetical protein P5509_03530 [Bacteroidales bacterium]|nr:hypothetical protein [Bacteroidales bacterium]